MGATFTSTEKLNFHVSQSSLKQISYYYVIYTFTYNILVAISVKGFNYPISL